MEIKSNYIMKTLGEYLKGRNEEHDEDVYVDGINGIAVCGNTKFTEEGLNHFKNALDLEMNGLCVMGSDEDYDDLYDFQELNTGDGGRLMLAWELLTALAGYCAESDYNKWFKED